MDKLNFSIKEALLYSKENKLNIWVQAFLRDNKGKYSSPNLQLAEGLLLEERFYIGPMLLDLDEIIPIRTEQHILNNNDLIYYDNCVNNIYDFYEDYNLPPLIVEYKNNKFYLTDGNHRYSAFKKMNIKQYYVIIWGNKNKESEVNNILKKGNTYNKKQK